MLRWPARIREVGDQLQGIQARTLAQFCQCLQHGVLGQVKCLVGIASKRGSVPYQSRELVFDKFIEQVRSS
jgi:hypothetical protein